EPSGDQVGEKSDRRSPRARGFVRGRLPCPESELITSDPRMDLTARPDMGVIWALLAPQARARTTTETTPITGPILGSGTILPPVLCRSAADHHKRKHPPGQESMPGSNRASRSSTARTLRGHSGTLAQASAMRVSF